MNSAQRSEQRASRVEPRLLDSHNMFLLLASAIVSLQLCLGLLNIDAPLTRGHSGVNTAAYLGAARNSLRFDTLLPYQFHTDVAPPLPEAAYTHAPLALHLHSVAAVWLLGDSPRAVRGVAAVHGVLVVLALLFVTQAHWSRAHALIAAATYTVLPINAIYVNMSNHSAGLLFWSILMFHSYLRMRETGQRRWFLMLLVSAWCALQWDWPAYYLVFFVGLDWSVSGVIALRKGSADATWRELARDIAMFSAVVLVALAGQWLLMRIGAGGQELGSTFQDRQSIRSASFARTLRTVPRLMFTLPVLGIAAVWLLDLGRRLRLGLAQRRDLVPVAFGAAGVLHLFIFRQSAWQHEYWLWPALPFAAWTLADLSVRGARKVSSWNVPSNLRGVLMAGIALPCVSLLVHSATLVPEARQVGGSLWFLAPVRGARPQAYDSGLAELRFAQKVRAWTERSTGVLLHASLDAFVLETRFDVTLDRTLERTETIVTRQPAARAGIVGWVVIGATTDLSRTDLVALADRYAVTFYDHYFMIDLRRRDASITVLELERLVPSTRFRLFEGLFDAPVRELRSAEREVELRGPMSARPGAETQVAGVELDHF